MALAAGVTLRAYLERPNFYSATILIAQSNGSLMVRDHTLQLSSAS